jgi:hypothetical protein
MRPKCANHADRANSAHRLMQQQGLGEKQVAQVRGFADQLLRKPEDPFDPSNRRISLIVQYTDKNDEQVGKTVERVKNWRRRNKIKRIPRARPKGRWE